MKTIIKIIPNPTSQSYSLLGSQTQFLQALKVSKFVNVDVERETKTSVHISLHLDPHRFGANVLQAEGLKYLTRMETNMLEGIRYEAHYLKAKTVKDVQKHVEAIFTHYYPTLNLDGFTLRLYETETVKELL